MTPQAAPKEIAAVYNNEPVENYDAAIERILERLIAGAFRAGFEHAVAGGDEAAKVCGIQHDALPLVMYFGDERSREWMVDAIKTARPDLIKVKIPERQS